MPIKEDEAQLDYFLKRLAQDPIVSFHIVNDTTLIRTIHIYVN
jgi:hypothetical protein